MMRRLLFAALCSISSLSFAAEIVAGHPLPSRIGTFVTPTGQVINQFVPSDRANRVFGGMSATTTSPGNTAIGFGRGGSPIGFAGDPRIAVEGGNVIAKRTGVMTLPGGAKLPVDAAAKVTGAAMAPILVKAMKVLPAIGTGVALYELAKELGYTVSKDGTGQTVVTKQGPAYCNDVNGCPSFAWNDFPNDTFPTAQLAAEFVLAFWAPRSVFCHLMSYSYGGAEVSCVVQTDSGQENRQHSVNFNHDSIPYNPNDGRSDLEHLADAIAIKSGWPSSSAIAQALADAQDLTGDTIPTQGPDVTGPSSVAGPKEVSTKPTTNGTKETTKQSNYECTYIDGATVMDGGSVACTERTTTTEKDTVVDPETQTTTTSTTQTEEVVKPADVPGTKPGEAAPVVDPCDNNPERAGCVNIGTVPDPDLMKKTTIDVTVVAAAFSESAGCPSGVTFSAFAQSYTFGYQPLCDFMAKIRTLVLMLGGVAAAFIFANSFKV